MAEGMELDPQLQAFLEKYDAMGNPGDCSGQSIDEMRNLFEQPYK